MPTVNVDTINKLTVKYKRITINYYVNFSDFVTIY